MAEKKMKRLTTDSPRGNFETMLNMVYPGDDGWSNIRHGEDGMPIIDFCFTLCEKQGCDVSGMKDWSAEDKDAHLCDCCFNNCPVATVYAAMCGCSHVRSRLKMYEDAGLYPDSKCQPENRVLTADEINAMEDGVPVWHDAAALILSGYADTKMVKEWLTYPPHSYGHSWRCWLRKPTEEERKAVPWE